jgi:HEAT repeat protein
MSDRDPGVRAVGATYLGIIHEGPTEAIPVLEKGLFDADAEVRRSSAAALGSFGADAAPALPSLRKASTDRNEDVAREAGRTIVKLQGGKEKTPDTR